MKQQRKHATGAAQCSQCDAVCCRLTVVLQPEDKIPAHLTAYLPGGLRVMARDEEGWCVALDGARMNCGIYQSRPDVCRRFVMGGPYCKAVRADYFEPHAPGAGLAQVQSTAAVGPCPTEDGHVQPLSVGSGKMATIA